VESELATIVPGTLQSNAFHWNRKLERYAKARQYEKMMELFQQMKQEGTTPDSLTFVRVLNACASLRALKDGRSIHKQIMQSGLESDIYVGSSLIDMYTKCGSLEEAWGVFNRMPTRNVVTWNAMILGHVKCGQGQKALELSRQMQSANVQPTPVTFVGVLNACASVGALKEGRVVHEQIVQSRCESNPFVGSSLVDMYAKCGSIDDAWRVFQQLSTHDVVTWNSMIMGYVKCGQGQKTLELYRQMALEGVQPDAVTFMGLLNACASLQALEEGRRIHVQIVQTRFESHVYVASSLVNMYAKCGSLENAWTVFNRMPARDVVAWSAMILGHVKSGQGQKALELFQQMQHAGLQPDSVTFVGMLNACASEMALEVGRNIHEQIVQSGYESDVSVGSSLVDMYTKCGNVEDAWKVFNRMPTRTVVSWNAMILGHVKCRQGQKALDLFQRMKQEEVQPDPVTFVGVLNACAIIGAIEEGRYIHAHTIQSGCDSDAYVATSLIDMYAKCGSLEDAWKVFNKMPTHNIASWNAMLGGYAMHGHAEKALGQFEQMCEAGVEINSVTFLCLLAACSHAGKVDEGMHYLESMGSVYDISVAVENYAHVVDLLGHAGCLHNTEGLINTMSCEPNVVVWKALFAACRLHGNVEMAERIGKLVIALDPGSVIGYVLLSNIYATAGKWDLRANIQRQMSERGVRK
jgi:pentatricopeptide repeat protein